MRTRGRSPATGWWPTSRRARRSRSSRSPPPSGTASHPGGGPKADPARQWERFNRSQAIIAELAQETTAARATRRTSRTTSAPCPEMLDVYRREHACWMVTGSTQYGRARASPSACLKRSSTTGRCAAGQGRVPGQPRRHGRPAPALPGRQVLQLRRGRLSPAGPGNDRLQAARLHVISGVNRSCARSSPPSPRCFSPPRPPRARVVVVATNTDRRVPARHPLHHQRDAGMPAAPARSRWAERRARVRLRGRRRSRRSTSTPASRGQRADPARRWPSQILAQRHSCAAGQRVPIETIEAWRRSIRTRASACSTARRSRSR